MPDFTMCLHPECPIRFECARSKASGTMPSEHQAVHVFTPDNGRCDMFKEKPNQIPA